MKITFRMPLLIVAILCGLVACLPPLQAAEANGAGKDSQTLLNEMRLKRWNKELELTADQQAKVKTLLAEEATQVAKLGEDKSLALKDRAVKVEEIHKVTYAKIKPLLTEKQVPVFEKLTAKNSKKAPAANP